MGTLVVVYGGSSNSSLSSPAPDQPMRNLRILPTAPLVGDILTLLASMCSGFYQVMYKKYAALPSEPGEMTDGQYAPLPESDHTPAGDERPPAPRDTACPLPFGLYSNLLTSAIGFCTFVTLWIPIPILHYLGLQPFAFPSNFATVLAISGIALSGVFFNAGYMVRHRYSPSCATWHSKYSRFYWDFGDL